MLGDLNGWIGDRERAGITGAFEVSRENENGRRWSGGKEHDRPVAGEEGYAAFCAGCGVSERNETRISDHHVVLCNVRLVGI